LRRRFGEEAVERLGEPLMAGIHAGDPEQLSIQAVPASWSWNGCGLLPRQRASLVRARQAAFYNSRARLGSRTRCVATFTRPRTARRARNGPPARVGSVRDEAAGRIGPERAIRDPRRPRPYGRSSSGISSRPASCPVRSPRP
jgi:hypothetical protein